MDRKNHRIQISSDKSQLVEERKILETVFVICLLFFQCKLKECLGVQASLWTWLIVLKKNNRFFYVFEPLMMKLAWTIKGNPLRIVGTFNRSVCEHMFLRSTRNRGRERKGRWAGEKEDSRTISLYVLLYSLILRIYCLDHTVILFETSW